MAMLNHEEYLHKLLNSNELERGNMLDHLVKEHYKGPIDGLDISDIVVGDDYIEAKVWIMAFGEARYRDGADVQGDDGDSHEYPEEENTYSLRLSCEEFSLRHA